MTVSPFQFNMFSKEHKEFIGKRISALRELKGLSTSELASKVLTWEDLLKNWESGKSVPDVESLFKIALTLDTSIDYIVCLEGKQIGL